MAFTIRRLVVLMTLVTACLLLAACGGDTGGSQVTGDSPQGIPVDSPLIDEVGDGGQAFPQGSTGVDRGQSAADESLTDGQ